MNSIQRNNLDYYVSQATEKYEELVGRFNTGSNMVYAFESLGYDLLKFGHLSQRLQDIKTLLEEKDSKVTVVSLAEYYKNERENWRPMTSTNVMSNLSNDALYEALVTINEMFFGSKLSGDGGMVALEGQA